MASNSKTIIIGAGLAGLITACKIPHASVIEAGKRAESHKALLRFRDESVSKATGIPFRAVTVRKGIVYQQQYYDRCAPNLANLYSRKVTGRVNGRSIWNLDTVTRYIAPEDFYDRLCDSLGSRIHWETTAPFIERGQEYAQYVTTIPLPAMMHLTGLRFPEGPVIDFNAAPIVVKRYRLRVPADVYQTIYFPELALRTYRASITGGMLIIEQMAEQGDAFEWKWPDNVELRHVAASFGLEFESDCEPLEQVKQKYGKITDISREQREAILYELTREFNVFSVGRFATWRNILLDDVVKDVDIVSRLMQSTSYGRELVLANR